MIPGVSHHAAARFAERYGWAPTPEQWAAAVLAILDRRALLMACLPATADHLPAERWRVSIGATECEVSWVPADAVMTTVFPPGSKAVLVPLRPPVETRQRYYSRGRLVR